MQVKADHISIYAAVILPAMEADLSRCQHLPDKVLSGFFPKTDRASIFAGISCFQLIAVPADWDGAPVNALPRQKRWFPKQFCSLENRCPCIDQNFPSLRCGNKGNKKEGCCFLVFRSAATLVFIKSLNCNAQFKQFSQQSFVEIED